MAQKTLIDAEGYVANVVEVVDDWTPPDGLSFGPDGGAIGERLVDGVYVRPSVPITSADVDAERDRRLGSVPFGGRLYDFNETSRIDIAGAGALAQGAIISGAQPGDLRWANPDRDFVWIAADNVQVTMDAPTMFAFAQAAAMWRADHVYAARALKDMTPIPGDYADDQNWPSA